MLLLSMCDYACTVPAVTVVEGSAVFEALSYISEDRELDPDQVFEIRH
jgi:hypothetical protein